MEIILNQTLPASNPASLHRNPYEDKKRLKSFRVLPEDPRLKKLSHSTIVKDKCLRHMHFCGSALGSPKILSLISCNRCIVGKFGHQIAKLWKHGAVNESMTHHDSLKNIRWKSALCDTLELEVINEESSERSVKSPADQSGVHNEDIFKAYATLEPAYLKFLSECGMGKRGYWRGSLSE
ncbi:uncharacterized protein [Aristolochia californica]|uniref:uncharacterized protein isoform X2 n=1 Tax=Aristolochia californica TaxID=171875 RepID=UPI0035E05B91